MKPWDNRPLKIKRRNNFGRFLRPRWFPTFIRPDDPAPRIRIEARDPLWGMIVDGENYTIHSPDFVFRVTELHTLLRQFQAFVFALALLRNPESYSRRDYSLCAEISQVPLHCAIFISRLALFLKYTRAISESDQIMDLVRSIFIPGGYAFIYLKFYLIDFLTFY